MSDLKLMTKVLLSSPKRCYDPSCIPMPWVDQDAPTGKLAFGLREFDRVVMPHPPILRAMRETAAKLERAGHEGMMGSTRGMSPCIELMKMYKSHQVPNAPRLLGSFPSIRRWEPPVLAHRLTDILV